MKSNSSFLKVIVTADYFCDMNDNMKPKNDGEYSKFSSSSSNHIHLLAQFNGNSCTTFQNNNIFNRSQFVKCRRSFKVNVFSISLFFWKMQV